MILKKQPQQSLDSGMLVLGEGEDYFLSLFGESKKLTALPSQAKDMTTHLSVILEEVGQFTSRYTFEYLNICCGHGSGQQGSDLLLCPLIYQKP